MSVVVAVGVLGLVAIAACWGFALALYRVAPAGSTARMLAVLLVVEGATLVTADFPAKVLLDDPGSFYLRYPLFAQFHFLAHTICDAAMFALYPPFLAAALQTKLTRPFARKDVRIGLWIAAAALVLVGQLSPMNIGVTLLYLSLSLLFGFGLVASLHAWYVATPRTRVRAGVFSVAFGIRDLCWGFVYAATIWAIWGGVDTAMSPSNILWLDVIYALGTLLAIPLITYGILRAHLFDIDLRVRWTIKQSTLATVVVTLIFLLSEGADRFLSEELGNVGGLFAAALVVFFLAPLQRFAEKIAGAAMPNTQNTPEYAAHRKMQVYEEAIAEAQKENGISDKERALLNLLRDSLGISQADAEMLERELLAEASAR